MASPPPLLSSSIAPDDPQQDNDHLLFSRDRNFELHGEIMMLIFLLLFAFFLSFLFLFLYIKRIRSNANLQDSAEQVSPSNKFSGVQLRAYFERGSKPYVDESICVAEANGTVIKVLNE
ncbi:hypothetical protein DITRI_Ditri12bG0186100 [Diplodiscus trichospermus]